MDDAHYPRVLTARIGEGATRRIIRIRANSLYHDMSRGSGEEAKKELLDAIARLGGWREVTYSFSN